jgi:hypothetical protein
MSATIRIGPTAPKNGCIRFRWRSSRAFSARPMVVARRRRRDRAGPGLPAEKRKAAATAAARARRFQAICMFGTAHSRATAHFKPDRPGACGFVPRPREFCRRAGTGFRAGALTCRTDGAPSPLPCRIVRKTPPRKRAGFSFRAEGRFVDVDARSRHEPRGRRYSACRGAARHRVSIARSISYRTDFGVRFRDIETCGHALGAGTRRNAT